MNAPKSSLILLLALTAGVVVACAQSDFVGTADRHAKDPATATPAKTKTPGTPGTPDAGDDTDEGHDKPSVGTDDGGTTDAGPDTDQDQGTNPNPPIDVDSGEVAAINHVCTTGKIQEYTVSGSGFSAKISGELCPRAFGKLTIMFIVDFSGSMEDSDPGLLGCGRSAAAKAILDRIKKDMRTGDDIQVGFVAFGDTAKLQTAPKPIKDFTANFLNFCGHGMGATNYKAAFELAQQQMQAVQGNKVTYFISDGLPTTGGNGPTDNEDSTGVHKTAGLDAAKAFRAAVEKMALNAIFLDKGNAGAPARTYLEQITGDPAQVKVATEAGALADKIVELSIPKVDLKPDGVTAELVAPNFPAKPVKLELFEKDPAKPSTWRFRTEVVQLNKVAGATVKNELKIKAKDDRGTVYEETMIINTK